MGIRLPGRVETHCLLIKSLSLQWAQQFFLSNPALFARTVSDAPLLVALGDPVQAFAAFACTGPACPSMLMVSPALGHITVAGLSPTSSSCGKN